MLLFLLFCILNFCSSFSNNKAAVVFFVMYLFMYNPAQFDFVFFVFSFSKSVNESK